MKYQKYLNEISFEEFGKKMSKFQKVMQACHETINTESWMHWDNVFKGISKQEKVLFRGVYIAKDTFTKSQRDDRRPADSDKTAHMYADRWFEKNFGWKARSEGLLVTPRASIAQSYTKKDNIAHTYMVFPKGPSKYIWSPDVHDFYPRFGVNPPDSEEKFYEKLDKAKYTDKNLSRNDGEEVMVKASAFTYINTLYYPDYCIKFSVPPDDNTILMLSHGLL